MVGGDAKDDRFRPDKGRCMQLLETRFGENKHKYAAKYVGGGRDVVAAQSRRPICRAFQSAAARGRARGVRMSGAPL